ncbi:hypothetical protein [Ramlibacter lithotrophicus]|uniref:hypothetical protein n=1 Tax=Ramlibacter lithotrophicus TaxID=2606681 RepID=UPI00143B6F0D|nr:hypothetical protein [Ramlibacter lithotrophicus]
MSIGKDEPAAAQATADGAPVGRGGAAVIGPHEALAVPPAVDVSTELVPEARTPWLA